MTALMVLALTVPPSLAAVVWRVLCMVEAQAQKLSVKQAERIDTLASSVNNNDFFYRDHINTIQSLMAKQAVENARLAEQVTNLTERVYRQ